MRVSGLGAKNPPENPNDCTLYNRPVDALIAKKSEQNIYTLSGLWPMQRAYGTGLYSE